MPPPQRAEIGIAHSSQKDLSDDDVLRMVREAVDHVGGIRAFVRQNDTVVLKPNQTLWFLAEDGVTTDPRVVAAMVQLCREAGAGHVVVGDSSGGDLKSERVLTVTGVKRLALDAGADEVVGFEDVPQDDVTVEIDGRRMRIPVPKVMLDAQVVINLPKAKTHFEDLISCALKNWVGIIYQKDRPSFMWDPLLFKTCAHLHQKLPAQLTVVDGLWAGEGTGPATNDPVWLGCVVAGRDPVAVDATVARLMGLDASQLKFANAGVAIGLGVSDAARIDVRGARIEQARIRAKPSKLGFDHLPIRVLVGEGVTMAGSVGHLKSIAETLHKFAVWPLITATHGKPTFMIGGVEDPDFEKHVKEGPYFVIDDAAYSKYKTDRRVVFVPGHPATHNIFPYIFRRLHVGTIGPQAMKLEGVMKQVEAYFHNRGWSAQGAEAAREKAR